MRKQRSMSPLRLYRETLSSLATATATVRVGAAAAGVSGDSCPVVSCLAKCHPFTTTC